MKGVARINENCNVCMCILFPWSHVSPTWRSCSQKWELPCMYVYIIPMVTYFPKHGGGCSHKWELQCMYMYNIPLITYFPNMEELLTAIRIAMYMCILFLWSHISPTWRGLLKEMRIAMSVCVYYSFGHVFPQTWRGLFREMRIALSVRVYYSLNPVFPQHEWVARRNENCNVCMCILLPWSHVSPTCRSCSQKWELQCMYVYIIPMVTYFPKHGWVCSQKWELQCMYVYIIPLITYFPNMDG